MRRFALLIGNTDGLPGVSVDMANWRQFLLDPKGGLWEPNEVELMTDPSLEALRAKLLDIKSKAFDYVVVTFSGHGDYCRQTRLYINPQYEKIGESELKGLSTRQLTVFDSCRNVEPVMDSVNESLRTFSVGSEKQVRDRFDNRIMQSYEQQAVLYSCSIGQSAYDSSEGGYYTKNLLKCARMEFDGDCNTVNAIHDLAKAKTYAEVLEKETVTQVPDSVFARCVPQRQLIISLNF